MNEIKGVHQIIRRLVIRVHQNGCQPGIIDATAIRDEGQPPTFQVITERMKK
ncbi:MAG: hypothetical protein HQL91_08415 [Magnetococcales bacterium]|nr:hypothetical protein [Magnetococcales bacterium]